jgi:Trypsin-like peptidase domain
VFANAVAVATGYTSPVIMSRLFYDGSLESALAAFVFVNPDGWILTAAHIFDIEHQSPLYKQEIADFEARRDAAGPKKAKHIKANPKWLVDHSYWWGHDGVGAHNITASFELDIAVAQLKPFDPAWAMSYPKFKDPAGGLQPGTALCKLGFPFHEFTPGYTKGVGFTLPPGALPAPFFPLEGMMTRHVFGPATKDGKHTIKFLETSSPGLKGQSGGPIFDKDGVIWAIQSRTINLSLGFDPVVTKGEKKVGEHQFLNLGWGVHPEVVRQFLQETGVMFESS